MVSTLKHLRVHSLVMRHAIFGLEQSPLRLMVKKLVLGILILVEKLACTSERANQSSALFDVFYFVMFK